MGGAKVHAGESLGEHVDGQLVAWGGKTEYTQLKSPISIFHVTLKGRNVLTETANQAIHPLTLHKCVEAGLGGLGGMHAWTQEVQADID